MSLQGSGWGHEGPAKLQTCSSTDFSYYKTSGIRAIVLDKMDLYFVMIDNLFVDHSPFLKIQFILN